jgi:shikimate kinase
MNLSGERADHGRSALAFRVEPESGTKEGKHWTFERNRKVKQRKDRSNLLRAGETEKSMDGFSVLAASLDLLSLCWHICRAMKVPGNIFLIGPMGAGKSTVGRHLAQLLDKEFHDADQEIEKRTGASVALIFDIEGEHGFRKRETAILDELTRRDNMVLATGGGVILSEENRGLLRSRGTVVYLDADVDTLTRRTHRDRKRPLLQTSDRREKLAEIMKERESLYRSEADVVVTTDRRSPVAVAHKVATTLQSLNLDEDT